MRILLASLLFVFSSLLHFVPIGRERAAYGTEAATRILTLWRGAKMFRGDGNWFQSISDWDGVGLIRFAVVLATIMTCLVAVWLAVLIARPELRAHPLTRRIELGMGLLLTATPIAVFLLVRWGVESLEMAILASLEAHTYGIVLYDRLTIMVTLTTAAAALFTILSVLMPTHDAAPVDMVLDRERPAEA